MASSSFDYEKAIQALLLIAVELEGPSEHKAFKTLYFAERDYLTSFGNTMLGDQFIKMTDGPVPSVIYDLVKVADNRYTGRVLSEEIKEYVKKRIHIEGTQKNIYATDHPDLDYLAETEKRCLFKSIDFCRHKSWTELRNLSHDSAWDAATMNKPMDTLKIAAAGEADEITLDYLAQSLANNKYYSL